MSVERHSIRYARLFELRVLHHYWLDEGSTLFDQLPVASQEERLLRYDARSIFAIEPTPATAALIAGLRGVWKPTSLGLVVAVPVGTAVVDTSVFELTLRIVDADFASYSAYGLTVPSTQVVWHQASSEALRFRTDAAVYSNLTGCARELGGAKQLFLSREAPPLQAADRIESIVNDAGALVQLVSDPPTSLSVELGPDVDDLPGFATHADIPDVPAVPDVVGALPARGILLPVGSPSNTHALIRVVAVHPGDADFSCTAGGVPKDTAPVFQLRFKNRFTLWRHIEKSAPDTVLAEEGPFPLTLSGNPSTGPKPSSHGVKLERDGNAAITNLVSEIFI